MKKNKALNFIIRALKSIVLPLLVFVIFAIMSGGRSASSRMLLTTLRQSVVPALICWGIMLNMTVGMMNFSAGAVILTAGIIGGNLSLLTSTGVSGFVFFVMVIGLLTGLLTGILYIKMRVPCMVLTIGLMLVFEALPRVFFESGVSIPYRNTYLAQSPYCFIILGLMLVIYYLLYNKTTFGHNLRAIGANQAISDSIGLDSDKIKSLSFIIGSLFLGVAAVLYISSNGEVRNIGSMGSMLIMMDAFMGMFLAMFLSRQANLAFAVPISVFTMKLIANGFVSLGISATIRDVTNGLFLLVLLAISANQGLFERIKADRIFTEEAEAEYRLL
jgi:ribose transport system permease protein